MAIINGNNSNNTLNGTAVADTIDGMGGSDTINGLGGNDILRGGSGNDTVNGGIGNDTITGGSGDDALNGGDGNDTFVYATFDGLDTFAGGTGTDRIVLAAAGTTLALRSGFGAGNSIEAIDGIGNSTIRGASSADTYNFSATTLTGIASIDVGAGNDRVTGSSGADRIRGGLGDDTIAGGGGADTLEGDDGADTLTGGAGADRLIGGTGNDFFVISTLSGGADRIADFGNGADTLRLSVLPASGVTASNLASFVRAQRVDGNVVVRVDTNGATGGSAFVDAAVLEGFAGTTVRVQIGSQFFNVPIPNRNPTLDDDAISVDEDATTGNLLTTLLTGDTDPDGDVLRVTGVTQGGKGTVFFNAGTAAIGDETIHYAADGAVLDALADGETTTDTFTYTVSDGHGGIDHAKVTVTITGINEAPRAQGVRTSSFSYDADALTSIVQPDGAIVVAGSASSDFALVRFLADGTLDPTFGGGDGIVTTDFRLDEGALLWYERALLVARQPDGMLVVAGQEWDPEGTFASVLKLARYNADGTLDFTFGGGDGLVSTPFPVIDGLVFRGITVLSDGKLVASGGTFSDGGNINPMVTRFNADGTVDTTFGGGTGFVTTPIGFGGEAHAAIEQPGGKVLVVSTNTRDEPDGPHELALLMYNADGSLDSSFGGGDGIVTVSDSRDLFFPSVVQQSDGKIVLASDAAPVTAPSGNGNSLLTRFNPDGTLDATFGDGGRVLNDDHVPLARSMIQQADGKLVALGLVPVGGATALVRYNSDGSLDTTFGDDGVVTVTGVRDSGADVSGASLSQQADGKLVVSGDVRWNVDQDDWDGEFAAIRFNVDGTIDESFRGLSSRTVTEETPFSIALPGGLFVDPDADSLEYTLTLANGDPLPAWISFDAATNTISGTPPSGAPDVLLRITATDPHDLSDSYDFTLVTESLLAGATSHDAWTGGSVDMAELTATANPDWTAFADYHAQAAQFGADVFIDMYGGNGITLLGVSAAILAAEDARA